MTSFLRNAARSRAIIPRTNVHAVSRATIALKRQYATAAAAIATDNGEQSFFPDEPKLPIVQTQIPGPKSQKAIEKLSKVFDTRSLNMMADYSRSYGN